MSYLVLFLIHMEVISETSECQGHGIPMQYIYVLYKQVVTALLGTSHNYIEQGTGAHLLKVSCSEFYDGVLILYLCVFVRISITLWQKHVMRTIISSLL